jgi:tetratricopeptide (TPR) repeat protein
MRRLVGVAAVLGALAGQARAVEPMVDVPDLLRHAALPLPTGVRDALRAKDWGAAAAGLRQMDVAALRGPEKADHAFVLAWVLLRGGRPADAAALLPVIGDVSTAPLPHLALLRGEVQHAVGRDDDALRALDQVPQDHRLIGRAVALRMEILAARGAADEAAGLLASLIARPDPTPGNDAALLGEARRLGVTSPGAYAPLRRLWTHYPVSEDGRAAAELLTAHHADRKATDSERIQRAERLMDGGMLDAALQTLAGVSTVPAAGTADGCRYAFVRGRSLYKKNDLSDAVSAFGGAGRSCGPTVEDYGAKILYLQGYAEFRRGRHAESAAAYGAIADLYPDSTMADDGLARGGISLFEAGDEAGAIKLWQRALDGFAGGDAVPEASFRLAFAHYLAGRTAEAIAVAERTGALDPGLDWYHVIAGQYWAARWRVYPDVQDPRRLSGDKAEAVGRWRALIEAWPQNYYALLAYARLRELAPDVAQAVAVRPEEDEGFGAWTVRRTFFEDLRVGHGVALARLGLVGEAMAEWEGVDLQRAQADEVSWLQELRVDAGDWLGAHKWMQQWLKTHPVGTLGPHEAQVVALGFPNRYWEELAEATAGYAYAPRMFHGLVREESSFDKDIVSFAGARGLSQVMPGTWREVIGWMGIRTTDAQMFDATINLRVGGRYLQSVYQSMSSNPFLAMASYNGGPGRISGWVTAWGNPPIDEYVERIPVRETRDYVKKVSTSWQVMRYAFDREDPPFPDLSAFNHVARP